ncbi:probable glycosyltransferase At5g03795 [Lotus japonicus]|uniref:probable glycosyltransferase At5g03795 n=1 Tax=Lotus japonicus TaxID=34305 RepID=UPI0025871C07|nr:probable glycosyltransferase At5g03795 [Lotus japonicus]
MGGDSWNLCCSWRSTSSSRTSSGPFSSMKLLLFMLPLVLVAGLICVKGPNPSSWFATTNQPLLLNSVTPSASNSGGGGDGGGGGVTGVSTVELEVPPVKQKEGLVMEDVVDLQGKEEKTIPDDNTAFNQSFTSPVSVQDHDIAVTPPDQPSFKDVEGLNVSQNWTNIAPVNESYAPSGRPKQPRKYNILDRTEVGLLQARAAIREARNGNQTQDMDYVPAGPMYYKANAFHRSYLEMEKQFKVFVYEEGDAPIFHNGPCRSIYSTEGNFINAIDMNDHFRTRDPEKAHVFFLPFSITNMVRYLYVPDSHDRSPIQETVKDYVNLIAQRYPFWNRSLGADHFMLSCHDWGPMASQAVPNLYKNSIRVLCNANTSEGFKPGKDASFPEINLRTSSIDDLVGGPSPSKRSVLAFFAGRLHGPIRPPLLEHWENKDGDMQVYSSLPKGVSYYDMLRKSKFCLCPSGYEVASPRVVEAIYTGCVPVLISEHYVPPFSDVLNWKSFSLEVSVKDIPRLKEILLSVNTRQYIRMQRRVGQIRRHFEIHSPPKRFDVFHMVLHSVWLRRLNFRVHDDQ